MPTEKKWVVDEKGFHAVTQHVSASSSNNNSTQPADTDADCGTSPTPAEDTGPEVKLSNPQFVEGPDGFQFNKKCCIQVNAELLKETSRKKVSFKTFVVFEDEEEDLGQPLEGFINDEGLAKADMMLFYGEKYSQAIYDDPKAKCFYKFVASHPKGSAEVKSDELEMPYEAKKNITLVFEDEDGTPITNLEVELSNGDKFSIDENGQLVIEITDEMGEEIEVVSITQESK